MKASPLKAGADRESSSLPRGLSTGHCSAPSDMSKDMLYYFVRNAIALTNTHALIPAQIASAGADARRRFLEFFTANIRNRNTRQVYALAVSNFFHWCEGRAS
jgi:hypothetical protein